MKLVFIEYFSAFLKQKHQKFKKLPKIFLICFFRQFLYGNCSQFAYSNMNVDNAKALFFRCLAKKND